MLSLLLLIASASDAQEASRLLREGLLALQANQLSVARESLERAEKLSPDDAYVQLSLAQTYWRLEDHTKALHSAERARERAAEIPAIAHGLILFYSKAADYSLNAGDGPGAVALAQKVLKLYDGPASQNLLGRALTGTGDPANGLPHLERAYRGESANPTFAFDYAKALLQRSEFTTAVDVLTQTLALHPNDAQAELALGVARYGQRRFEDAISAFLRTIELDGTIPQPYVFLGRLLDQAGPRLPQILNAYQNWYHLFPERFEPSLLLAKAELASGADPQSTERHLRESIRLKPEFWESHFVLGQLLAQLHNFTQAAVELEHSCQLNTEAPMPHYHLARVYDRLGEVDKARQQRALHARLAAEQKSGAADTGMH